MASKNITTGEVTDVESNETPTVCVPNDAIEVAVVGPYRQKERKLWAYLVHRAYEHPEFGRKLTHQIDCREVSRVFKSITGTKNTRTLWEYIENLGDIKVLLRGKNSRGITHLLAFAHVDFDTDIITYQIPAILEEFFLEDFEKNSPFSRLRTHFLIGLNGKYSVSLYMLLEQYANRKFPILVLTLDELRTRLKIEDGKMVRWPDLRRFVIEPSVKEINEKTVMECENDIPNQQGAGFTVVYEPMKRGQKVISVRFKVTKHTKRVEWENGIKKEKTKKSPNPKTFSTIPIPKNERLKNFVKAELRKVGKENEDINFLIGHFETQFRQYIYKKGACDTMEDVQASFAGFIVKAALREKLI